MKGSEIRQTFLDFFAKKGHTIVPSSSLIPDDPSVLLTTAGMQQFKPYYTELDPKTTVHPSIGRPVGENAASCQKSFRTSDIDEVGDERHLTFFEMLGNFSFGGYFKKEAISYAHEFLTKELGLTISYVTIFCGKDNIGVPKDEESKRIWQSLGVTDIREEGMEDVFWGPTGTSGPCGPTTEIYCKNGAGEDIEVWNIVFNQFFYPGSREELLAGVSGKKLELLPKPGVDTGMGLERLAMIAQKTKTIFETDLFDFIIRDLTENISEATKRIIADHARAVVFLIGDGIIPSNKGAGYILRRLIRRLIIKSRGFPSGLYTLLGLVIDFYKETYPELHRDTIYSVFEKERDKFQKTADVGIRELGKMQKVTISDAFMLFQSYGLPYEVIKDLAPEKTSDIRRDDFDAEFAKHQEISRAGQEKKFGGHGLLLDTGELKAKDEIELKKVTRLHTATHMLQRALREVLGPEVKQAGSDITVERTRFDFSFPRKLTSEEIRSVETLVNTKIGEDLPMQKIILPKAEAEKTGALYFFKEKYPDPVNVYFIGENLESAWSKEFCGGPHVSRTGEIGKFRIVKEEAVGAGVRRIRAIVEP